MSSFPRNQLRRTNELVKWQNFSCGHDQTLQYWQKDFSPLASFTPSHARHAPSKALQALDQGRGVIASLLLDTRLDTSELREKYPVLWYQYTQCQEQITQQTYAARTQQLRDLFQSSNELGDNIRKQPGFETFLLPPTPNDIQALARDGPIVCFNVSSFSCEAFIVTTTAIQVLSLPELDEAELAILLKSLDTIGNRTATTRVLPFPDLDKEELATISRALASQGNSGRRNAVRKTDSTTATVYSGLQHLWDYAVKLVLQETGLFNQAKDQDHLPRIWWVGGGSMSLLPLHAAGNHTEGSTENTLSHVVSSYAPTLKSLQFIQKKPAFSTQKQKLEIMVVSMPTTAGHSSLNVAAEVAAIEKHRPLASVVTLYNPTKKEVLERLSSSVIAHFACHGYADMVEPSKGALIVGGDTEERLTIGDLDALVCSSAQIAYLSACSTAEIKVQKLVNESIHLASSFQLIGFQHVIGTLWAADDNAAVIVAGKFYEGLLQHNNSNKSVPQALNDAIVHLRNQDSNRTQIWKWAAFIHLGC